MPSVVVTRKFVACLMLAVVCLSGSSFRLRCKSNKDKAMPVLDGEKEPGPDETPQTDEWSWLKVFTCGMGSRARPADQVKPLGRPPVATIENKEAPLPCAPVVATRAAGSSSQASMSDLRGFMVTFTKSADAAAAAETIGGEPDLLTGCEGLVVEPSPGSIIEKDRDPKHDVRIWFGEKENYMTFQIRQSYLSTIVNWVKGKRDLETLKDTEGWNGLPCPQLARFLQDKAAKAAEPKTISIAFEWEKWQAQYSSEQVIFYQGNGDFCGLQDVFVAAEGMILFYAPLRTGKWWISAASTAEQIDSVIEAVRSGREPPHILKTRDNDWHDEWGQADIGILRGNLRTNSWVEGGRGSKTMIKITTIRSSSSSFVTPQDLGTMCAIHQILQSGSNHLAIMNAYRLLEIDPAKRAKELPSNANKASYTKAHRALALRVHSDKFTPIVTKAFQIAYPQERPDKPQQAELAALSALVKAAGGRGT